MKQRVRILFLVCSVAIAGVIVLQVAWLNNYFQLNKERFDKEVNLAFEDAVKKEFIVRCDTLEKLLYNYIADTACMRITSTWSVKNKKYIYTVINRKDSADRGSFSLRNLNLPVNYPGDSVALLVARQYARMYRDEDLENHIIY